ncbi:MAG: glycosyltransferase family 2 protein [Lachnospiraceae bacterium]|nr:glycosyltransferase family 2 protein [Lachnospiraceae bacterium]
MTISLCMIVKDEEKVLGRCLDSLSDLVDEMIIVDTGSKDATKRIAAGYTDKIYDFKWVDDFSKARNFAFEKAGCDYIYSADADEYIDEKNREKFKKLKEALLPEVEIVQMYYANQLEQGSLYNFDRELRAKLFKRVRSFTWVDPVHEHIRELPLVYDSDIEIKHMPLGNHTKRDLDIFAKSVKKGIKLSKRLNHMYAKELMIGGRDEDILRAEEYFTWLCEDEETDGESLKDAVCLVVRGALLRNDSEKMYHYALKEVAMEPASEVCYFLGKYYYQKKNIKEAIIWFYNAAFETESALDIRYNGEYPFDMLKECYKKLGNEELALDYEKRLKALKDDQKL